MTLWLLDRPDGAWQDEVEALVIRAETEPAARELAAACSLDEGPDVWRDAQKSTCVPVSQEGAAEVVLRARR